MSSYLPDKTFVVCTNQLGITYRQLTISENRTNKTVALGSEQRVFLVKIDKNLTSDFTCKSGWSSGAGTAAVGAGVITGLAIAASVAAVPVAGWIAGGIIAIGCLAYGAWQMLQSPSCSQMVGYEESKWIRHHETVRFDSSNVQMKEKHLALVKSSMLKCKEPGGMLLPFISSEAATAAAEAIGYNNRKEMATNIAAGFFTGFLLGTGLGGAASTLAVFGQVTMFTGWTLAGYYVINPYVFSPATSWTSEKSAQALGTSESYDYIKSNVNAKPEHSERNSVPDPAANNDTMQSLYIIGESLKQNHVNKQHVAEIDKAISAAKKAGTYKISEVPEVKVVLEKIKNGTYGEKAKEIFTNKNGTMKGKNTHRSHTQLENLKKENIVANRKENIKNTRNATILVIAPFVSSFFGNEAIRLGVKIYDNEISNAIRVSSIMY